MKEQENRKMTTYEKRTLMALSEIMSRSTLFSSLGLQYDGDRNIYDALGYPETITFEDYWLKYKRQDIAGAIINRPVEKTWKGYIHVQNQEGTEETLFNAWKTLLKDLKLKSKFIRADKLSSVGRYGVLLLGFSDVKVLNDWEKAVVKGNNLKLLYVSPYTEMKAVINTWVEDTTDKRYGLPLTYNITTGSQDKQLPLVVHYSRVIHIVGEELQSEVYGVPVLERVYNRLLDLQKIVGGSAEMYWRGARPGVSATAKDGFNLTSGLKDTFEEQMQEFEHNMRRTLVTKGLDIDTLESQVSDPNNHVDVQLQMISAITGIPKRILVGSERGELSSGQDEDAWNEMIETRREEYAEQQIIIPLVDLLMEVGILPDQEYEIEWENLHNPTDKDKADIGKIRAETLKSYSSDPMASTYVPPEMFFKFFLGLKEEQIEEVLRFAEEQMIEDEKQALEDDKIAQELAAKHPIEEAEVEEVEEDEPMKVTKKKKIQ